MKLVGLISGGKDSLFNLLHCIAAGHDIVALGNIEPEARGEIDSYMYQSVGHEAISLVAGALALPIYRQKTKGKALCQNKIYVQTKGDEVEDLLLLLEKIKKDIPIEGVSVGAIKSDYQRSRVESVCKRLQLKSFAYLWERNQTELLQEMIDAEFDAIIIKVASIGLTPSLHLGVKIKDIIPHLADINQKFGVHVCGEGGEYETLTLDCPLFHRKISILESEKITLSNAAFAEVGCLNIKNAELKSKKWGTDDPVQSLQIRLANVHSIIKSPYNYVEDCVDDTASLLFPQGLKKSLQDLPFPFQDAHDKHNLGTSNFTQYWKPPPSLSNVHEAHSSQKVFDSPSSILSINTITSQLNYTTGWACIGNITGASAHDAFFSLQKRLERMSYELADGVLVNIYLKDMDEYQNMNKVYSQYMPEVSPPARVCVAIPLPANINILIVMTAHKCVSKIQRALGTIYDPDKEILHVQSISHWAPANIGPYSQCVKVGSLYYIAGQIPLIPGSMEMLNKPIIYQFKLTLRHVLRIMQAMTESLNYSNILQAICYVTSEEIANDIPGLWSYITGNDSATVAVLVVKSLPRNAHLELETVAVNATKPQVYEKKHVIEDCTVNIKQCLYMEPLATSFICKVSYVRKNFSKTQKLERTLSLDKLTSILKFCSSFIRRDVESISSSLCIIKLFYDSSDSGIQEVIFDLTKNSNFHHKVVLTGIPVISSVTRETFLTITGLCH